MPRSCGFPASPISSWQTPLLARIFELSGGTARIDLHDGPASALVAVREPTAKEVSCLPNAKYVVYRL